MAMKSRSTGPMPFQPTGPDAFNDQLLCYLVASNFAWYTYDWLLSTSGEVEIVSRSGLSWSIVVYFLSRLSEFGHVLMFALFVHIELNRHTVAPVGGCEALGVVLTISAVVSIACTSFLFFLRVRAVYLRARSITVIFGTLWLVTVAVNIFDGTSIHPVHAEFIPSTKYCTNRTLTYYILPSTSTFVYDTSIFLAISYRLAADAVTAEKGWRSRFRLIVGGKGLYRLSGLLMRSGLFYYLAMIFFFLVNMVMMESPLIHFTGQHYILVSEFISFTNIMACAAFRHVALCKPQGPPTDLTSTRIAAALQLVPIPLARCPPSDSGRGQLA
ncbi:hypothetical protein FIBSPDRAFT_936243 [Athelia psychrophila]|uniref:G-protein coupled receptors family 1 profile domain-containing protein n=1 Tax=Athelia psychrophila TaxID=1759441 RepID=A0A166CFP6_9AGAM|nr:hypothetical protein FIBSPDRAFT_936243 [Fibularhizoctonia sp. CBS 109695]